MSKLHEVGKDPTPTRKGRGELTALMRKLLSECNKGQGFFIEEKQRTAVRKVAETEFPEYVIKVTAVVNDKSKLRVTRIR